MMRKIGHFWQDMDTCSINDDKNTKCSSAAVKIGQNQANDNR